MPIRDLFYVHDIACRIASFSACPSARTVAKGAEVAVCRHAAWRSLRVCACLDADLFSAVRVLACTVPVTHPRVVRFESEDAPDRARPVR